MDEEINKRWSIHTMDDDSATERNEGLIPATTRMDLEDRRLKLVSEDQIFYDSIYMKYPNY